MSKYITYHKQITDSITLINKIKEEGWVDDKTVIINCQPNYSSMLTQMVNHKLSHLNNDDLYNTIDMQVPLPEYSQVWVEEDKEYQPFINYLSFWSKTQLFRNNKYLLVWIFPDSHIIKTVRSIIAPRLEPNDLRIASLYTLEGSKHPDYYTEEVTSAPVFEWENINIKI